MRGDERVKSQKMGKRRKKDEKIKKNSKKPKLFLKKVLHFKNSVLYY